MLDLRRLRLLRELADRGTIGAVAAALSFSPSSVSQQLAQLEREAGVKLLEPAGRGVRLTPAGRMLAERSDELFAAMESIETGLADPDAALTGTVRLAVFQSAALGLVPQALDLLAARHPALRVEVVQREPESALAAVWAREFDLVVAEQYPHHAAPMPAELDREPLCADRIRLGAVAPEVLSVADAAQLAWVMEPRGTASRHWAEQACRLAGFEPDVRFETADLQAHIRLVETGHAVALLPDLVWGGRPPGVRTLQIAETPRRAVFTAARRSAVGSPLIAAIRAALADAVASLKLG